MSYFLLLFLLYFGLAIAPWELFQANLIERGKFWLHKAALRSAFPYQEVALLLHQQAPGLNELVINKVLRTLKCTADFNLANSQILTIIDYSLPSNEKRLWVFDLKEKKLLFHTYVSHGITSGSLVTNFFSNKNNSKASSIGVYKTEQSYYGREGLSLRLDGLDAHFNDNAANRSVVMHGGWYVEEQFIKRYGRPGRSWGCPALPLSHYQPIINVIKNNSLLVAYYPSDSWFHQSKFLNCDKTENLRPLKQSLGSDLKLMPDAVNREEVLFANVHTNTKNADSSPIVAMSADNYEHIFSVKPPLERMLRRQIEHAEYIALSNKEFYTLANRQDVDKEALNAIHLIVPVIVMVRGYYETQMRIVNMGPIKRIDFNRQQMPVSTYVLSFEKQPAVNLRATNRFIRWLGL